MDFASALKTEKIRNVMVSRGIQVKPSASFKEVVAQLQDEHKFCAIVMEQEKVVGIFTERDALKRGLLKSVPPETPIQDLMTPHPDVIQAEDSLAKAIQMMHQGKHRHLPVLDTQETFAGLISARDIVYYLSENYPYEVYNLPPDPHKVSGTAEGA